MNGEQIPFIPIGSGLNRRTLVYDKLLKTGWEETIREMRGKSAECGGLVRPGKVA